MTTTKSATTKSATTKSATTKSATGIQYQLNVSTSTLDVLISEAIESANTMQARIQIASVAILHHAYKHGDYTRANKLVHGLGQGVKTSALVEWFVKFGGFVVSEEDACFVGWSGNDYIKDNFNLAKATMWWTFKQASPFSGFDIANDVIKLRDKANKMLEKKTKAINLGDNETADKISVTVEQVRVLNDLIKSLGEI